MISQQFLFFAILPISLSAQDILPDLIVTASRLPSTIEDTTYSTEILTAKDLSERAVRTLPQAFLHTPGVLVQQTTPGHGSPFIRGFTGRQNLLLQDGIRINNSTWRSGPVQYWNTLDSQAISRIELIRSQGSVLYGSDAIGGTVNTLTANTGFRNTDDGFFQSGAATYRFDTNSESHIGRVEQAIGIGQQWGLMLGLSAKDVGDIRDSAIGTMRGTGYSEKSLDFKFQYALSDSATLTLFHSRLDQDDVLRWHRTINNPGWIKGKYQAAPGTEISHLFWQDRSLSYARLEDEESPISWIDRWALTFSYQKTLDRDTRIRSATRTDIKRLETQVYGLTFDAKSPVGPGALIWGTDFYHDDIDSVAFRNGTPRPQGQPIADGSSYDSLGLFLSWQHDMSDRFSYSLGSRFTAIRAEGPGFTFDDSALVFSARARMELNDSWSLFGGLSESFRAPNLDDLTGTAVALDGLQTRGSLDLESEEYLTAELGVRHETETLSFELSGYYTTGDNPITRVVDTNDDLQTINGDNGYIYGFETSLAWQFHPQWELSGALAWQDGEQRRPRILGGPIIDDPVHRLHPLQGTLALTWRSPDESLWVSARLTGADAQERLSFIGERDTQRIPPQGTPGFLIASLYAGWEATENLTLTVAVENLTDEDYRIHGSGQNQPGLNLSLGGRIEW